MATSQHFRFCKAPKPCGARIVISLRRSSSTIHSQVAGLEDRRAWCGDGGARYFPIFVERQTRGLFKSVKIEFVGVAMTLFTTLLSPVRPLCAAWAGFAGAVGEADVFGDVRSPAARDVKTPASSGFFDCAAPGYAVPLHPRCWRSITTTSQRSQ